MSKQRNIRRLAMQVLYQIDVTGELDRDEILSSIDDQFDPPTTCQAAVDLALRCWIIHGTADEQVTQLAPDWPTHRQPPVDRAILRLAYYEIVSGRSPIKVAINEAVELSKSYAGENSPAFINGVLDKLAKRLRQRQQIQPTDENAWLEDATAPVSNGESETD